MITKAPRGTQDLFGDKLKTWVEVENKIKKLASEYGYGEIRTPIFEHTELFLRGVGETTDIVQKEMYSFEDKAGRQITLRPEGTAGVARAFLENKLYAGPLPAKLYYLSNPTFRYERPQSGRYRQFHQFGVELFGSAEPTADAEIIAIGKELLDRVGINKVELHINSLGGPECRKKYNEALKDFIKGNLESLCPTCNERFEKNPLRTLDCKNPDCQKVLEGSPKVIDVLDTECKKHFETVLKLLDEMEIKYIVDSGIVRGLDYYTRTVFEFISNDIGSQGTVCGGGRYDKLIEECGGSHTPAVGFGIGFERLLLVMVAENGAKEYKPERDIFIGSIGEVGMTKAAAIVYKLRQQGISAEGDLLGRSVKAQMKYANKIGAKFTVVLGDNEIEENKAVIKNMNTREQTEVNLDGILEFLQS